MSEQAYEFEGDFLLCERCGQEYSADLDECPFCEAERRAKLIAKQGSYHSRSATFFGLMLAIVLIAGGVLIFRASLLNGGWSIGREYDIEETGSETSVSAGITQQQTDLDGVETAAEEDEASDAEESAASDEGTTD